ncbi:GTPase HflX [Fibrobacterota bacterium]
MGRERAIVVGVAVRSVPVRTARTHLRELARLADTAGAKVVEHILQRRNAYDGATLVGSGKLREIAERVEAHDADLVLFDDDLTGSQIKKIESAIPVKVMDRSGIILDIFARNARTAESKIQVEVAQLEYFLPRLTRAWTHLCRQVGGIGTRGPGETQLEVDRRLVRKRIADLKKKLQKNEAIRKRQHDRRYPTFHVSLVGYTNAGKSSLMNLLTHSRIKVEDKLFATLDATTRKLPLGTNSNAVLSDTVGFIRKLPHHLVDSFKSTLSVVCESSLILQMVDVNEKEFPEQMEVTAGVLKDLQTENIHRIIIFNKIDLLAPEVISILKETYPDAMFISATSKLGIEKLKARIGKFYRKHIRKYSATLESPPEPEW